MTSLEKAQIRVHERDRYLHRVLLFWDAGRDPEAKAVEVEVLDLDVGGVSGYARVKIKFLEPYSGQVSSERGFKQWVDQSFLYLRPTPPK